MSTLSSFLLLIAVLLVFVTALQLVLNGKAKKLREELEAESLQYQNYGLTNRELARIFAMYYDQRCINVTTGNRTSVKYVLMQWYNRLQHSKFIPFRFDCLKLILKPLSAITDEHAIELANMLLPEKFDWVVKLREDYLVRIESANTHVYIKKDGSLQYALRPGTDDPVINDLWVNLYATDRLRELGYALPYKGKSLFELGVAIDVTTLN